MLPQNRRIRKQVQVAAANNMAVAELEYLGLSLRVVNTLEDKMGIVYLKDLIALSEKELLDIRQLGSGAIKQIAAALERFDEIEKERLRWNTGSDKTEYYKKRINLRAILA